MQKSAVFRDEPDSMGLVKVPDWAYWGAQTQRAIDNFVISGKALPVAMIRALGLVKKEAALANLALGLLKPDVAHAIAQAASEVADGKWDEHFPVDVFQTGSGTSSNMNANEVIANRANEILGSPLGSRSPVHPNDHVNKGQSSNDVIPSVVQIASRQTAQGLIAALELLASSLTEKSKQFSTIIKLGRTHLQDAVPMTLGQEFGAFAVQIQKAKKRIQSCLSDLEELPLGGTAIGTGLNCHPDFAQKTVAGIAKSSALPFKVAPDKFEQIAARDAQVQLMGSLNTLCVSLLKIANDLRLLASGPRGALGEIELPSLQPGSSIMPGKVNPVIPEMVIQVAAHVSGKVLSVSIGGQNAPLQLNMMNPLIGMEVVESLNLLQNACKALASTCIDGIKADEERCAWWIDWSLALVTPLNARIGYDKAAELAYKAFKQKRKIREVVLETGLIGEAELDTLLDPRSMIGN